MPAHTINGQTWVDGTLVNVYPAANWPRPEQAPAGTPVTSATVAGGSVTFNSLALVKDTRYVAYAAGHGATFLIPEHSPTNAASSRLQDVEADVLAIQDMTEWDDGDTLSYGASAAYDGLQLRVSKGTAASPDRSLGSLIYVSRKMDHRVSDVSGTVQEALSGIACVVEGTATCEQQPVAGYFIAKQGATAAPGGTSDAIGVQGTTRMLAGAIGSGIGVYAGARLDSSVAACKANAISAVVQNFSGVDQSYVPNGPGGAQVGLSLQPGGNNRVAAGIAFYHGVGEPQFDVGIAFTSSSSGAVLNSSIRDDSTSVTSLDINGTHTYGVDLDGATCSVAGVRLNAGATNGLSLGGPILYGLNATTAVLTQKIRVEAEIEIDGALNHDGSTVGFYNAAPVAKQTGVAVTAAAVHAALVNLGLIGA